MPSPPAQSSPLDDDQPFTSVHPPSSPELVSVPSSASSVASYALGPPTLPTLGETTGRARDTAATTPSPPCSVNEAPATAGMSVCPNLATAAPADQPTPRSGSPRPLCNQASGNGAGPGHRRHASTGGNGDTAATVSQSPRMAQGLVETAVGVRELSRKIGRARVKLPRCKRVLIVTKLQDRDLVEKCRDLALWLIQTPMYDGDQLGLTVYVDAKFAKSKTFDYLQLVEQYPHCRDKLLFWTPELCNDRPNMFDFVLTLGGDGTVLYTSWLFQTIVPAVIPFHMGSLGFLTCFDFANAASLIKEAIVNGIRVNLRMRFTCVVYRTRQNVADGIPGTPPLTDTQDPAALADNVQRLDLGDTENLVHNDQADGAIDNWDYASAPAYSTTLYGRSVTSSSVESPRPVQGASERFSSCFHDPYVECHDVDQEETSEDQEMSPRQLDERRTPLVKGETFQILNELTVDRGPSPYMSVLELFGDRHHLTTVQADGLTIATPTGSTAYSLAAGGSLVHPEIPAILITPNCPHTLSFRPMLLPDSMELVVAVPYSSRNSAWASFDGRHRIELRRGDHIRITASNFPFPTVCYPGHTTSNDWFESLNRCLYWNHRARQKEFS